MPCMTMDINVWFCLISSYITGLMTAFPSFLNNGVTFLNKVLHQVQTRYLGVINASWHHLESLRI